MLRALIHRLKYHHQYKPIQETIKRRILDSHTSYRFTREKCATCGRTTLPKMRWTFR